MKVVTTSSAQRGDKYATPSGNQNLAETGVGHLIAKRPILVSLACQLGFGIKKIGGSDHRRLSLTVSA
ncbi:hypothetical protein Pyn_26690 [Prunus yedoensis var. nudiflora]|uniref:Uncharacterized protein n=1 Tax=Prunus yedoensis var. nudiflora TaxID=2094558 RepID=A0A314YGM7_PRUYE|nr:hypothetical protein Pyn_26690 [Prunus yedoensis var. nudiflora]